MLSHFLDNVQYSFTRNVKKLSNDESFGVYILIIKFVEGLKDLYGEIMTTSQMERKNMTRKTYSDG